MLRSNQLSYTTRDSDYIQKKPAAKKQAQNFFLPIALIALDQYPVKD